MHWLEQALETFGVRVIAPLGGRLNQHWLVHGRGEELVLRCWSQPGGVQSCGGWVTNMAAAMTTRPCRTPQNANANA